MEKEPSQELFHNVEDVELLPEVKEIIENFPYLKMVLEEICAHHPTTLVHLKRCGNIAYQLAEKLNYKDEKNSLLVQAALCHDVGKYTLPLTTLDNKGDFTIEDWDWIRTHPEISADYVNKFAPLVAEIVKRHHLYQKNPYPKNVSYESDFSEAEKITIDELSRVLALLKNGSAHGR